LAQNFGSKELT